MTVRDLTFSSSSGQDMHFYTYGYTYDMINPTTITRADVMLFNLKPVEEYIMTPNNLGDAACGAPWYPPLVPEYDVTEDSVLVISLPWRCDDLHLVVDTWTVTDDLGVGMYAAFFTLDYTTPDYKLTVAPVSIDIDYTVVIDAVFNGWYPGTLGTYTF